MSLAHQQNKTAPIAPYQVDFIKFLREAGALTFGDFVTKSGRKTPYFINTGKFDSGAKIANLGEFYATHIVQTGLADTATVIFGPAYKGIPLAVATAIGLERKYGKSIGYAFDRKEVKDHGDGGLLVGKKIGAGEKIVLVEDVITAGTTLRHILPLLRALGDVTVSGVVLAVDRAERGAAAGQSAVTEAQQEHQVSIFPIVTIHQIVEYYSSVAPKSEQLPAELLVAIGNYLAEYGA